GTRVHGTPMLTIRVPQLMARGGDAGSPLAEDLPAHLATHYPQDHERLGEGGRRRHVDMTIELGARHRIVGEASDVTLAELLLEHGESFERSPDQAWARTILEHPRLPGVLKVRVLAERLRARRSEERRVGKECR